MAHDLLHEQQDAESVRGGTAGASGRERLQASKHAGTEAGKQDTGGQKVIH